MKLIYFIVIILVIYFIASQIRVIHIDKLSPEKKTELNNRSKARSMLIQNYIKEENVDNAGSISKSGFQFPDNRLVGLTDKYSSEQFQSTNYKRNFQDLTGGYIELPNASNLLFLIESEYIDDQYAFGDGQYVFNITNQPVTTRNPNRHTIDQDAKYLKHIKKDIESWNELFYKYFQINDQMIFVRELKPQFIMETTNEFVIQLMASIIYRRKSLHFNMTYYGQIDRADDFLNGMTDVYTLQLINIKPIPKSDFDLVPKPFDRTEEEGPFISMKDQMKYVDRINRMHRDAGNRD